MAKTIITAALTGAITPHGYDVPETPEAYQNPYSQRINHDIITAIQFVWQVGI